MNLYQVYPIQELNIVKGKGSYVYDSKGTKYLDFYGGHAVISIGHTHPHYVDRLSKQLQEIGFYSNSIQMPLQEQLAGLLGEVSGLYDYQLFLCNSGAEANENALKMASFYTLKNKVISFSGGFHGRTSLAVSVTDNPKIKAPINQNPHVHILPFNDEVALEQAFDAFGDQIAAVILEGIQGVGGIQEANPSFLSKIRALTTSHQAVFIADEVQCGYGRTGKFNSIDHHNIQADIYTMAKGMGNGFPIGAIALSPKFKPWHGQLGTTFGGNHLACVAALSVLEVIQESDLMQNAHILGSYLKQELKGLNKVVEVRGKGLMLGIELPIEMVGFRQKLLFEDKIFTGASGSNVIRLLPPLTSTKADADLFLEAFTKRLQTF